MERIRTSLRNLVFLTGIALMFGGSACSRNKDANHEMSHAELESKLNIVLREMTTQADAKDQEALRDAQLFNNLQGLDMDIVGFSVPINGGSNRVHISFMADHFQRTPPRTLAAEGLEDLQMAKAAVGKNGMTNESGVTMPAK